MHASPTVSRDEHHEASAPVPRQRMADAPTRMFHWLFALSFAGAYLTAESEHWRLLHVTLGYSFAGLLAFRLAYGVFGPQRAGLGLLWRKLSAGRAWLRSLAKARLPATGQSATTAGARAGINWRQGQNLAMALAVLLMLALVIPLTLSGYATYNDWGDVLGGDWLEDLHEFFANAFLAVVLAHLGLIALLSVLRRQNQALPMLPVGGGSSPLPDNNGWLAALLLLMVLLFGAWQWQDSPQGLFPGQDRGAAPDAANRSTDDEDDDD